MILERKISNQDILKASQERAAVKKFDPRKKLDSDTLETLIECARLAPSSLGLQPHKIVVVTNKEIMAQLQTTVRTQLTTFAEASALMVICKKTDVTKNDIRAFAKKQADAFQMPPYEEPMMYHAFSKTEVERASWIEDQAYIVLGYVAACAAAIGVDALPMEEGDHKAWDDILGLTDSGYASVLNIVLGYRLADDIFSNLPKVRKSQEEYVIRVR